MVSADGVGDPAPSVFVNGLVATGESRSRIATSDPLTSATEPPRLGEQTYVNPTHSEETAVNSKDIGKLIALAFAFYGAYSAYQDWQRQENIQNGVGMVIAGVTVFTTLNRL